MIRPAITADVSPETRQRWEVQALVWRILYGHWRDDLQSRIRQEVGEVRASAWGAPDLGANLLKASSSAVSTLYDEMPAVYGPAAGEMADVLGSAGWPSLMQRHQRDTIGCREYLLYAEPLDDGVRLHSVAPHEVEVLPDPAMPDQAIRVVWWRLRTRMDSTEQVWTRDVWDARPGRERYHIEDEHGADVSAVYLRDADGSAAPPGGYRGDAYPFRASDGTAYVPWVVYHAARTGRLWDYGSSREIVDSTLTIGTLWTYWRHLVQTASWPQRYLIGGMVAGSYTEGDGSLARTTVVADPAVLLRIVGDEQSDGAPTITQDSANADPLALNEAITAYERRAVALAGLNPADVQRVSGDPRSGYALAINRDAQRMSQARYAPVFAASDELMIQRIAYMLGLPGDGWRVSYRSLPMPIEERIRVQAYVDAEIAAGRMTQVQAYMMLHPDLSADDAAEALAAIGAVNAPVTTTPAAEPDEEGSDE